jgi:hypothetical protein
MLLPKIKMGSETIVYMADLLPSTGHIPLPYVMGYDMQPLITLEEKEKFLTTALMENYIYRGYVVCLMRNIELIPMRYKVFN